MSSPTINCPHPHDAVLPAGSQKKKPATESTRLAAKQFPLSCFVCFLLPFLTTVFCNLPSVLFVTFTPFFCSFLALYLPSPPTSQLRCCILSYTFVLVSSLNIIIIIITIQYDTLIVVIIVVTISIV